MRLLLELLRHVHVVVVVASVSSVGRHHIIGRHRRGLVAIVIGIGHASKHYLANRP